MTTTPIRPRLLPQVTSRADTRWSLDSLTCRRSEPRRSAFTLVELVVVLSLFTILSSVGWVRFAGTLANSRADATASRIAADLALARTKAITTSSSRLVVFTVASSTYSIINEPGIKDPSAAYLVDLTEDPYRAVLVSADFASKPRMLFDGYGTPSSSGTVTIRVGTAARRIVLDEITGSTSIVRP